MDKITKLKEMISKFPDDCFSRHALAMELLKMGNIEEAIHEMEELLLIDPNYVGTYYHLAKAYEKLHQYSHSLEVLERGIKVAVASAAQNDLRELNGALDHLKDELDLD